MSDLVDRLDAYRRTLRRVDNGFESPESLLIGEARARIIEHSSP